MELPVESPFFALISLPTLTINVNRLPIQLTVQRGNDDQFTCGDENYQRFDEYGWRVFDTSLEMCAQPLVQTETILEALTRRTTRSLVCQFVWRDSADAHPIGAVYDMLVKDTPVDVESDFIELQDATVVECPEATVSLTKFGLSNEPDTEILFYVKIEVDEAESKRPRCE